MTPTSTPPLRRQASLRDRSEAATAVYHQARTACVAADNARSLVAAEILRQESALFVLQARELSGERGPVTDEIAERSATLKELRTQLAEREPAVIVAERALSEALRDAERAQALADLSRIARNGQTVLSHFMPVLGDATRELLVTADRIAAVFERLAEIRTNFLTAAQSVASAITTPSETWTADERDAVGELLAELQSDRIDLAAVREHWPETPVTGIDEGTPLPGDSEVNEIFARAVALAMERRQRARQQAAPMEKLAGRAC
ncbi:MAG: hypothetical protein ACR2OG_08475 [Gemmatimonadaceae bacterium]